MRIGCLCLFTPIQSDGRFGRLSAYNVHELSVRGMPGSRREELIVNASNERLTAVLDPYNNLVVAGGFIA
jgi:hypothetical protein